MSTTNIITMNQLIKMFSDFADAHLQLNDFGYGPTSDIGTSRQMDFPYMWATHRGSSRLTVNNKTQIPQMTMTFLVVDQINIQSNYKNANGLDSDNSQEVISDTLQIIQDFVTYVSSQLGKYGVKLMENDITCEPVFDETPDKVSGWVIDMDLQLRHSNCSYPIDGIDVPVVSNCPTAIVKNSNGTFSISITAGATQVLPDVTHTDSDGSSVSLPAQTSFTASACPTLVDGEVVIEDSEGNILHTVPVANDSTVTQVVSGSSITNSNGSFNDTVLPEGSKTLADVDITLNGGDTIKSSPSNIDIDIEVEDDAGATVGVVTGNKVIVPAAGSGGGTTTTNTAQLQKTNQLNVFYAGDDGDTSRGRNVNFTTLSETNAFGNTNRFTDTLGTQVYANDVVLDWSTFHDDNKVTAYKRTLEAATTYDGSCTNAPYTHATYDDWYPTNWEEYFHICDKNFATANYLNYAPFNIDIGSSVAIWTGSRGKANDHGMVHYNSGFVSNSKSLSRNFILTRTYTLSQLGLTSPTPEVIGYHRPFKGQTTSFVTGDEGWENINNIDPYIPPINAKMAAQDPNDWFKLVDNNAFGNKSRFTSKNGGYYDFVTSTYRDVDGNSTTFFDEFQDGDSVVFGGYIIDHLTGLGWIHKDLGTALFGDFITTFIPGYNSIGTNKFHGYTDWKMPTSPESMSIRSLHIKGAHITTAYGNESPYFAIHRNCMTTSTYPFNTAFNIRVNIGTQQHTTFSPTTGTNTYATLCRPHYT